MITLFKLAAVGAALSVSAFAAYDLPMRKLEAAAAGKFQDRLAPSAELPLPVRTASVETTAAVTVARSGKGDRLVVAEATGRSVTIENRVGANVSVLTRVGSNVVASR